MKVLPSSRHSPHLAVLLVVVALLVSAASPAQSEPRVGYVYPAGLQRGTVGEVVVGGSGLQRVTGAMFSGPGLRAQIVTHTRPLTGKERATARERLTQLRKKQRQKDGLTRAEQEEYTKLRKQLTRDPRQQLNPQLAETVVMNIAVAADAELGSCDLRLRTATQVSNPMRFEISDLPERREIAADDRSDDRGEAASLPVILNGQILPGEVDRFRIHAIQGTQLVAAVRARALIPYLADAVPGWFQAVLTLYDSQGLEVVYSDDHWFSPDPLLVYDVPADGDYVLEIRDAIYRGRQDFVYRIAVGEVPFVTSVFPLGARVDRRTEVTARGFNLDDGVLPFAFEADDLGVRSLVVEVGDAHANAVPFAVDRLPETSEREPNDEPEQAQRLGLPKLVNGTISHPGDRDVFEFSGRAGDRIIVEVLARRLGSPLDSMLRVTNAHGRELARNDDHVDPGAGLTTHQADSLLSFRLPAKGIYCVHLSDVQHKGGPEYGYRLRIGPPRPDFALRVVPSALSVRAGATAVFTVHALRHDGFDRDIQLELVDPPPGFRLSGAWVPGGQDVVQMTLTAPAKASGRPVQLQFEGRAKVRGKELRRRAVPAEDMMQAFVYRHLVPAEEFLCVVARGGSAGAGLTLRTDRPVRLPAGGTVEVQLLSKARRPLPDGVEFVLPGGPEGVDVASARTVEGGFAITFRADSAQVEVGQKGNLIVDAFLERTIPSRDGTTPPRVRRNRIGTLPAISFEVVRR